MSSSKLIMLLPLVLSLAFHQAAIAANPLSFICSSTSGNFSDYSPYQTNLNKLLTILYVKAPSTGFALHTITTPYTVNSVNTSSVNNINGLTLCRGDASSSSCQSCVAEANNDIRILCPNNKEAVVWYDACLLKYSDTDFFGHVDKVNGFQLVNVNDVKGVDPALFNGKTRDLLTRLAAEASSNGTRLFAGGEAEVYATTSSYDKTTVYGMAQCTRDLSSSDCKACLDEAIAELPSCCGGKQGGRVVGASCSVQYEIYPFLKS